MIGESFLLGVAQIGMVLAGFGGVVAVFRHTHQHWLSREIMAVRFMFEHSFAVVFFSLVPFLFLYASIADVFIWKLVSFFLALFLVFEIWITSFRLKQVTSRYPRLLKYTFFLPSLFFFEVEILNSILWGSLSIYALGLLWLLVP